MVDRTSEITANITEIASNATGMPVEDLPPLRGSVDPDALSDLVLPAFEPRPPGVSVMFRYAGLDLVVHSGNIVYARQTGNGPLPRMDMGP